MTPYQVAILAGGKGTRLQSRSAGLPKALMEVAGRPLLLHQIDQCRRHGYSRILLLVHHGAELIQAAIGDGSALGVEVGYHVESIARGTAGALRDALPLLDARFLVVYGDTYFDVDLRAFESRHVASGASATLFLHPNDHPADSDLVELDGASHVVRIHPYPHPAGRALPNLVNAALYVLQRDGLERHIESGRQSDIAKHLFPAMLAAGMKLRGDVSPEYVKDMGTPERLDKVEADIETGLVEARSARHLRAAVFMDRDGTINRLVDHLADIDLLALLPGAAQAIRDVNRSGMLAVVATNQPVVARGDLTEAGLERIHHRLGGLLGEEGAFVDGLYVCPHHPDRGFSGEVEALKIRCDCRKPETGLVDAACRDLGIDRGRSWFVGDATADIACGRNAGVRTILVRTGLRGEDGKHSATADYVVADLRAAVDWILGGHPATQRRLAGLFPDLLASRLILVGGLARSGKSSTARACAELLAASNRRAHVVCLDAWLRPPERRLEGSGVQARYDIDAALADLLPVIDARRRTELRIDIYDRGSRRVRSGETPQSIGVDDTLIVEGVPALLVDALRSRATVRLFTRVGEPVRVERLRADYAARGMSEQEVDSLIASRDADETPPVSASVAHATMVLHSGGPD